jgi:hypothetical protein
MNAICVICKKKNRIYQKESSLKYSTITFFLVKIAFRAYKINNEIFEFLRARKRREIDLIKWGTLFHSRD